MITWDQEDIINYGLVGQNLCPNCLSTPFWYLKKVSKCISIFFIPILPIESEYWFQCPICNYALSMDRDEFKIYKLRHYKFTRPTPTKPN